MKLVAKLGAALSLLLMSTASQAIDAPPGAEDLRGGLEPLAQNFDAEKGRHRLLLLLSPA